MSKVLETRLEIDLGALETNFNLLKSYLIIELVAGIRFAFIVPLLGLTQRFQACSSTLPPSGSGALATMTMAGRTTRSFSV